MKNYILLITLLIVTFVTAQENHTLLEFNHVTRFDTNNQQTETLNAISTIEVNGTHLSITLGGKAVNYTILVDTYEYVEPKDEPPYILYDIVNRENGTLHSILILSDTFYLAEDMYYFKFYNQ